MVSRFSGEFPCLVLTVEHGGNRVPPSLTGRYRAHRALLESHCGWDPGAASLGRRLATRLGAPVLVATTSRLVVDLNRTGPRRLWDGVTGADRVRIANGVYRRHWTRVRRALDAAAGQGHPVIHVGVHTFTPQLDGTPRRGDVCWLYDPGRPLEAALARRWRNGFSALGSGLLCRMNYPYRGIADGMVTALRRERAPSSYVALELEVNQRLLVRSAFPRRLSEDLAVSLRAALGG